MSYGEKMDCPKCNAECWRDSAECKLPHLGLATTRELLAELSARIEVHATGGLDYRTVDGEAMATALPSTARTAEELDAILNSEDTSPCTVLPDGSVVREDCQCPKCGRIHRHLGNPPASIRTPDAGEAM